VSHHPSGQYAADDGSHPLNLGVGLPLQGKEQDGPNPDARKKLNPAHSMSVTHLRENVMQDLYQLVGRLEQSTVDVREDISDLRGQIKELHTILNALLPRLEQASKHASDWETTKRRGVLYLAAAGATGIASTLGLQKLGPLFFAIIR
jgi:hypothetical protein